MGYRTSALSTALGAKQSAIGVGRCFHLLVNLVDVSWDTVQNFKLCACRRIFFKSWPFRSSEVGPLTAVLCLVRAGRRTHGSLPRLPSGTFRPPALPPFTCRRETMASAQALRLAHPPLRSAARWPNSPVVLSAERPGVGVLLRSSSRSSWMCQRASNSPGKKGQRATPSDGQEGGKKPRGEKRFCVRPGSVQQARGLPLGGSAPAASVCATKPRPFGEAPNGLAVRESDPCAQLPRGLHVAEPPGSLPGDWGHWCQ